MRIDRKSYDQKTAKDMSTHRSESDEPSVFLLHWMSYDLNGNVLDGFERDDCMLIGVYTVFDNAKAAMNRAATLPGFDCPHHFLIDRYPLDKDNWTSGFCPI